MLKTSTYAKAVAVASLISTVMAVAPVRADDGGLEDPPIISVAYSPTDSDQSFVATTCEEQRKAAWFLHELARTDGAADSDLPKVDCRPDFYAESAVEAD